MEYNPEGKSEFWAATSLSISPKISNVLNFSWTDKSYVNYKIKSNLNSDRFYPLVARVSSLPRVPALLDLLS